ncbi:MAG: hypothetical protein AAF517_24225 [Planctomycetota bacterium]
MTLSDRALRVVIAAAALWFASAGTAHAGSLFMKNGYIIQGPIVDFDDESYVLGWDNGKVTVFRRFVESIAYDPGEKERLDEQKRLQADEDAATKFVLEEVGSQTEELDDLPADLDVYLRLYQHELESKIRPTGTPETTTQVVVTPPETSVESTPETHVEVATPEASAGLSKTRVQNTTESLSLLPPMGWVVKSVENVELCVQGPKPEDGRAPSSFNVVSLPKGELSPEDCIALMREAHEGIFGEELQILSESKEERFGERVFQMVGRGTAQGRSMVFQQWLLPREGKLWLISAFTSGDGGPSDQEFAVVQRSLDSLQFE